jgi:hypothetical protein
MRHAGTVGVADAMIDSIALIECRAKQVFRCYCRRRYRGNPGRNTCWLTVVRDAVGPASASVVFVQTALF